MAAKLIAKGEVVRKDEKYLVKRLTVRKEVEKQHRVRFDEGNSSDSSEGFSFFLVFIDDYIFVAAFHKLPDF